MGNLEKQLLEALEYWKAAEDETETYARTAMRSIARQKRDDAIASAYWEESAPDSNCYGCQGTGAIRWTGPSNGKPCPCRDREEE